MQKTLCLRLAGAPSCCSAQLPVLPWPQHSTEPWSAFLKYKGKARAWCCLQLESNGQRDRGDVPPVPALPGPVKASALKKRPGSHCQKSSHHQTVFAEPFRQIPFPARTQNFPRELGGAEKATALQTPEHSLFSSTISDRKAG